MPAFLVSSAVLAVTLGTLWGCSQRNGPSGDDAAPRTPPSTQPVTLVGTLRGGMMAIGGETGGWMLAGDGATGGIELDVSAVQERAEALDGQRVSVTGMMKDHQYVERGTVRVLMVNKIQPAPQPPR